jgi:hypothetical protein
MSLVTAALPQPEAADAHPSLHWLTAARCRVLAAAAIAFVAVAHWTYLSNPNCPIDLAEDECYYWDWSRHLDWSFFSKGPLTATVIRASCALLGDTMPAVRLPAVLFRAGIAACTFFLTLRLFRSHRLALGAVLLSYLIPMMLAVGLVITTDPPFVFFWAVSTCFAAVAIFDGKLWAWFATGVAVGLGFLTKFSMPLWFVGLLAFLLLDRASRHVLLTKRPCAMLAVFAPLTFPVLYWNARHSWITFRHVGEDVGVLAGDFAWRNFIDFWTGQLGVVGPLLGILMFVAVAWGIMRQFSRERQPPDAPAVSPRRAALFLLCFSLPIFLGVMLSSFRKHPSANWAASSYFAFTILTAHFLATRNWRRWRYVVYPALVTNLLLVLIAHRTELLYPTLQKLQSRYPGLRLSARTDPTYRLHAWKQLGQAVSAHLSGMPKDIIVMAGDYQVAAALSFYVNGQPQTYSPGSYYSDPAIREPVSQFDLWPHTRLDNGLHKGRPALHVGPMPPDLRAAFDRVTPLPDFVHVNRGLEIRRLPLWKCEGFKGMRWPGWDTKYNK